MKRMLSLLLTAVMLASFTAMAQAEDTETFTWWIARGEDTSYYDNYARNPVIQYFLRDTYAGKKLDIQFWQGISGAERDNFNNMISTGDLADVIDLSYSDYTPATLYEDGYILDLTPYVEQYMPSYWALINEDAQMAEFAWSYVNGEKKILFLTNVSTTEPFEGYCYRRDWIAKYGVNPQTGEKFTWSLDENGTWTDDVVFPCGKTDPYYISDWEWMFEIFTVAMADLGITDGYCMSLYYEGMMRTGDLYTGFGGGSPWWYRTEDGNAAFGGTSDQLRTYLECMNHWWNKGWLDPHFAERSSDMFYVIDSTSVHQGKVGLWQGRQSEVGGGMDIDTPWTDGIMVYGAPQPINDVYGTDAQKNHEPDTYYTMYPYSIGVALTAKSQNKDLAVLLSFIDSLYTSELATVCGNGFSQEMLEEMPDEEPWKQMYMEFGLTEGIWKENGGDLIYTAGVDVLLGNAMKGNRLPRGKDWTIRHTPESRLPILQDAMDLWVLYPSHGRIQENITGLISAKDTGKRTKIENNVMTYMAQNLPKFIMGVKGSDIYSDTDWNNYCSVIEKYGVNKVTQMYQEALDIVKN